MKWHIKETERRFLDTGDVRSHQLVLPDDRREDVVIKFDNKYFLPGAQEIQKMHGGGKQVIRMLINGKASYFDSLGNLVEMNTRDIMSVIHPAGISFATLYNTDILLENDLIELWLDRDEEYIDTTIRMDALDQSSPGFRLLKKVKHPDVRFWTGYFTAGSSAVFAPYDVGNDLLLFLISGTVRAGGHLLHYRDSLLHSSNAPLELVTSRTSELLLLEIRQPTLTII